MFKLDMKIKNKCTKFCGEFVKFHKTDIRTNSFDVDLYC